MAWNWQQPQWPHFTWDPARIARAEDQFLLGSGVFIGSFDHLDSGERERLTIEAMGEEALTTSRIEGEILDRDSVQSSIRQNLGLSTDSRRTRPQEQGIGEMMVDLYRRFAKPLGHATLFAWHRMIMKGSGLRDLGAYRTHKEPMQIVSGRLDVPKVHFEAPPSSKVRREMDRFIRWFNQTAPGGPAPLPALTRAGIAHLHFESIHPFEDGNGRVGRAVAEMALAQALKRPSLTALSSAVLARRKAYYEALSAANRGLELTNWLAWFAGIALEAQHRTHAQVEFLLAKTRLLDKLRGQLNPRQEAALLRVLREGAEGFKGGLSAGKYSAITKVPASTATRDLAQLVELGALTRTGERKGTRYHLTILTKPTPTITIDRRGEVVFG
jgi:Fic family protein